MKIKLTKKLLKKEYFRNKLTQRQIGKKYNCSHTRIYKQLQRFNLTPYKCWERWQRFNPRENLTDKEKQILFGTLLGDGSLCIHKNRKNAYYGFGQKIQRKKYVIWIYDNLKDFCRYPPKIYDKKHGCLFKTICHPIFTKLHFLFYDKNKRKYLNPKILNQLGPLALACWFMDDGGKFGGKRVMLATHSFSYQEHKLLQKFFKKKFGLDARIGFIKDSRTGKTYYYLYFITKSSIKFKQIIKPYVLSLFQYKLEED